MLNVYQNKTKRLSLNAMFLLLCLVLSYLEAILPLDAWIPLPGFKFGLCNIMITFVFVALSPLDAAVISFLRILLMGILFGNMPGFTFSLCGGILSYIGLWIFASAGKNFFSMIGVSVGCAALHNIGQLIAAMFWFSADAVWSYLPFLLIASLIFGTVTGSLLTILLPRISVIFLRRIG